MGTIALLFFSFLLLYILRLAIEFHRQVQSINGTPGYRVLFSGTSIIGNLIPWVIPGVAGGRNNHWVRKHEDFKHFGADGYSSISFWPKPRVSYSLADAAAIKEITSSRARWPKPLEQYSVIKLFGINIVVTEGDEWKKHRRVANPAFSERNNRLVWDETVLIVNDMIENVWENKNEIDMDHCGDMTLSLALLIIGRAGFGRGISWHTDLQIPPGHKMAFKDALHMVSTDLITKVIFPDWVMGLTPHLRKVRLAFAELQLYMEEMIQLRRCSEKKDERFDLFSSLLDASEEGDEDTQLTDSELIGNIFIFLLAGHETSAHTLCFAMGLLALYQEEQELLYQHIKSVLPDGRTPKYEDMHALTRSFAVFNEALRMYPPVVGIPKRATEDTSLVVASQTGEKRVLPIPKGTSIAFHIVGLHYNPLYWKEPYEFRPQRFLEDWPRDAFIPFSGGARSCIGRRFSETESVAILTILVQKYKIEVKEEPQFATETFDERKERVLRAKAGITLTPVRVPLIFKRRM